MQPQPPQQSLQRRRSSVSDAFGKSAVVQGLHRANSIVTIATGMESPSLARSGTSTYGCSPASKVKPVAPPLFMFRHHQHAKDAQKMHLDQSAATEVSSTPAHPLDAQLRQDREQRKSIIAASMHEPSLAHLIVETRKEKLPLDQLDSSHTNASLVHSVNRRQSGTFVAFSDNPAEADEGGADVDNTNELWATVVSTNTERRENRKLLMHGTLDERVNPRWWRHLSLRDFSDFLTPGLFEEDELERGSDSDADATRDDDAVSKRSVGGESVDVQSPKTERPVGGGRTASDHSMTAPPREFAKRRSGLFA
ncbi:Hypothetical protein, putative [Bodo saltans]|uniref:Uncharacterized protein n=1 Tax=Bodo saltans TaxID=75058 RepID=A0A0S4IY36_BODSA|nr:Hypothetical protein, putative [Bodo saltans]|eukprot:CUF95983.1 Hypothetical protein, putative [Bodo saltans]